MTYLERLKYLYQKTYNDLQRDFDDHCQRIIIVKMKELQYVDMLKVKIEDQLFDAITFNDRIINLGSFNITDMYDNKYEALFIKFLNKKEHCKEIEKYLEESKPFDCLIKLLQLNLSGLKIEIEICVTTEIQTFGPPLIKEIICDVTCVIPEWD